MLRVFILGVLLVCISGDGFADAVIDEANFGGDFSDAPGSPTDIGVLELGNTDVFGTLIRLPEVFDDEGSDVFTFVVDAGQVLDSIELTSLDGDGHFWGFDDGDTSDSGQANELWVARLISGTDVGTDLLGPVRPGSNFFGSGVPGTIGAGDYTVWVRETNEGVFGYSMTLRTSAVSVPEPSSLVLLSGVGAVAGLRRKRRKN